MTEVPAERAATPDGEEEYLTTGATAALIGFGTTQRQVLSMIEDQELRAVRHGKGKWYKVPKSAALAKHRDMERQLLEIDERTRERAEQERTKQHDERVTGP